MSRYPTKNSEASNVILRRTVGDTSHRKSWYRVYILRMKVGIETPAVDQFRNSVVDTNEPYEVKVSSRVGA